MNDDNGIVVGGYKDGICDLFSGPLCMWINK